jgi:hypothetical protein
MERIAIFYATHERERPQPSDSDVAAARGTADANFGNQQDAGI